MRGNYLLLLQNMREEGGRGGGCEGKGGRGRKRLVNAIRSQENAPGLKVGFLTLITIWQ